MPFNGSGTFTRVHDWTTDRDASVKIRADRMDEEDDGFATGLSTAICKDGQTTVTANIPFNAKKITGLGSGTASTDAVNFGQVREKLTGSRSYFVRTDGSDSNTGLANTSGAAFLTIGKGLSTALSLDNQGNAVTVSVADGTYNEAISVVGQPVGGGTFTLLGNTSTPSNVVINATGTALTLSNTSITIQGVKIVASDIGMSISSFASVVISSMNFGACTNGHILMSYNARLIASGNNTISGAAAFHNHVTTDSFLDYGTGTWTISGTPAFSAFFVGGSENSSARYQNTWSGAATGRRAFIHQGFTVETGDGSLNPDAYFPGNAQSTWTGPSGYNDVTSQQQWNAITSLSGFPAAGSGSAYVGVDATSKAIGNMDDAGNWHTTLRCPTSYTSGDLIVASSTTALGTVSDVATGNALISGGGGSLPSYGKIGLTTHVSGTLPIVSGGTGITSGTPQLLSNTVSVNFAASGDNPITIPLPSGYTRMGNVQVAITGASANISAATFGVFTATGGGGTAVVTAGTAITVTSASDNTNNNMQLVNQANVNTMSILPVANTLYFRVGTTTTGTANVQIRYLPHA